MEEKGLGWSKSMTLPGKEEMALAKENIIFFRSFALEKKQLPSDWVAGLVRP